MGKAGVLIGGVAVAVVGGFFALSSARVTAAAAVEEEDTDQPVLRSWTNHAGGYYACSHQGCSKKVDPTIFAHDCCGRCWLGRECLKAAQRDYDGPGSFAHNYFEVDLRPGVCDVCGEPPEAHPWVFDSLHGERR